MPDPFSVSLCPTHLQQIDARPSVPRIRRATLVRTLDDLKHRQGKTSTQRLIFENSTRPPQRDAHFAQTLGVQVATEIDQGRVVGGISPCQPGSAAGQWGGFELGGAGGEISKGGDPDSDEACVVGGLGIEMLEGMGEE